MKKQILLASSIISIITPIATTVACGDDDTTIDDSKQDDLFDQVANNTTPSGSVADPQPSDIFNRATPLKVDPMTFETGVPSSIGFSTDPAKPNVVQIFTDGFDIKILQSALAEVAVYGGDNDAMRQWKELKDFVDFEHYYTGSSFTGIGRSVAEGGYDYIAPLAFDRLDQDRLNGDDKNDETVLWRTGDPVFSKLENLESYSDFSQVVVANEVDSMAIDPGGVNGLAMNYEGDEQFTRRTLESHNINFISRAETTNMAPPRSPGQDYTEQASISIAVMGLSKVDNTKPYGTRLLLANNIPHTPRQTTVNGTFNFSLSPEGGQAASIADVKRTVQSLKAMVDPATQRSAYDNTLIVVYGDHADHGTSGPINVKSRSNLMIKFPDQVNTTTDVPEFISDKTFYAADLKDLIVDYMENRPTDPMTLFDDPKFDIDRPVLFSDRSGYDSTNYIGHRDANGDMQLDNDGFTMQDPTDPDYLSLDEIINTIKI